MWSSWRTPRNPEWTPTWRPSATWKTTSEHGFDLKVVPYVLQLNKRDLPSALPADFLARRLRIKGEPIYEAVATQGKGVFDSLKAVAKLVLLQLRKGA